jgi:apolipoprotein N-acyltransferase
MSQIWRRWLPATLSGCLMFFSFADWDIWPFGFLFVVPLLYVALRADTTRSAFWWSLWAGWVANFGGFWWISGLLIDFGHMHWSLALGICLLLNLYQGLSFALFGALAHHLRARRPDWSMLWLAPTLWAGIELVTPLLFPYYMGNSQYSFPAMIQLAELTGPIGVSALLFLINGALYEALDAFWWSPRPEARRPALVALGVGAAAVTANLTYGFVRMAQVDAQMEAAQKLHIGMVEADIGIWEKEASDKLANNLIIHQRLSKDLADKGVDLLVWPESSFQSRYIYASVGKTEDVAALQGSVQQYRRWFPQDVTWIRPSAAPLVADTDADIAANTPAEDRFAVQRGFTTPILFGGVTFRELSEADLRDDPPHKKVKRLVDGKVEMVARPYRVYNSAVLLDEVGRARGVYNKTFLLAFGEYIPGAQWWPWVYDLIPEASEFTPGDKVQAFDFHGHRLGVMICYEDIIPAFGRKLAKEDPHVLINITNDAWFGKTSEPYLHLALATFRAVETRKWLLRSTNTGVTAFIDANGRVVKQTAIYEPEIIDHEVPMMTDGPTLYVLTGDLVGYLGLLGIAALLLITRRRRAPASAPQP